MTSTTTTATATATAPAPFSMLGLLLCVVDDGLLVVALRPVMLCSSRIRDHRSASIAKHTGQ